MSRNNQINSKIWTTADITTDTISEVWDFLEEAFEELNGVTFKRDTSNKVMYIYLDEDKKIYIAVKVAASGSGVLMEYYLGNEKCSYTSTTANAYAGIAYIRTAYGIAWAVKSQAQITFSYNDFGCIYTQKSTPTIFVGITSTTSQSNNTYYILSPLHDSIEAMAESDLYISNKLGDQKFSVVNAYSCVEKLKLRHLFRVLGIPSSGYSMGRVLVDTKKLFWFGRFALEFEEE